MDGCWHLAGREPLVCNIPHWKFKEYWLHLVYLRWPNSGPPGAAPTGGRGLQAKNNLITAALSTPCRCPVHVLFNALRACTGTMHRARIGGGAERAAMCGARSFG